MVPTNTPVPKPNDWSRIYEALLDLGSKRGGEVPKPPVPLILARAAFSTAAQIRNRWTDLIDWANQYGFAADLHRMLPAPPSFDVPSAIAGVSEDGRGWWNDRDGDEG